MYDRKPGRTVSWTALLFLTAIFGVNGCGDLGNKTAPNDTPIANAGRDQGSIRPGMLVTLNGSASSDPDGQPLTYSWIFVSRPAGSVAVLTNPTRVSPTFVPDLVGDYVARLIVNDGSVNSAPDTVLITSNNVPPVANAGPDQGGIAPQTLVTLNGAGSFDGDGDPLTFNWSFVSRPSGSTAVLNNSTSTTPTFTIDRDGDYVVQLIVNDGIVNSDPDTVTITSNNVPPVANAGPAQTVGPGLVTLDGSGSFDANGDPITYSWTLVSRPPGSQAALNNPNSPMPTFTVDRDGDYVVRLIVNDGTVNSLPDSVIITTDNVAPVANAGPDQGGIASGTVVTLNGSGSTDANGDPLTYAWAFVSRPAGSNAVLSGSTTVAPTFTVDRDGNYVVRLVVNDGTVDSSPDTVTITGDNVAPVANAGPDQGGVAPGTVVTLNGNGSSDANGDPLTYSWSLSTPTGSAAALNNSTSPTPTFTVDLAGEYVAQLIVNDGTVNSAPDSVIITTSNVAPVANAGPDQSGIAPGTVVTLNGSGSTDANGDPLTYAWAFVSRPAGSNAVLTDSTMVAPTFTVDRAGIYVVELIVNDGTVNSSPDTVMITSDNVAPVANAGADQGVATGALVILDGSSSSDANGDPLTYHWTFVIVPGGSTAAFDDPTSPTPTFTADVAGIYELQLIVHDGTLDSPSDSVTITTN